MDIRRFSVNVVVNSKNPHVVDFLINIIKDLSHQTYSGGGYWVYSKSELNWKLLKLAVRGLIQIGEPAEKSVIKALEEGEWPDFTYFASALRNSKNPRIERILINKLKDEKEHIRRDAARELNLRFWQPQTEEDKVSYFIAAQDWNEVVEIGKAAIPNLVESLSYEDSSIREYVAKTLDELDWKPQSEAERITYLIAKQDWQKVVKIGQSTVPYLIEAFRYAHENWQPIRKVLIKIGQPAVSHLIKALQRIDDNVCGTVAETLDELNWKPHTLEEKISYLIAKNDWQEVVNIGQPAVEYLIEVLKVEVIENRYLNQVTQALIGIGQPGIKLAVDYLTARLEECYRNNDTRTAIKYSAVLEELDRQVWLIYVDRYLNRGPK